jgi:hypothetical protein
VVFKICTHCNRVLDSGCKYCPECGRKTEDKKSSDVKIPPLDLVYKILMEKSDQIKKNFGEPK